MEGGIRAAGERACVGRSVHAGADGPQLLTHLTGVRVWVVAPLSMLTLPLHTWSDLGSPPGGPQVPWRWREMAGLPAKRQASGKPPACSLAGRGSP